MSFLLDTDNVIIKKNEINFGLKMLENNGDFSDGINAFLGIKMALNHQAEFIVDSQQNHAALLRLAVLFILSSARCLACFCCEPTIFLLIKKPLKFCKN